jgi:hypothetical protein
MTLRPFLALGISAALLAGCATPGPEITSDRNPETDASTLQTWAWVDPLGTDRAGYETVVTTRLKRAVQTELQARGMRYSEDDPDALVNFYVNLEEAQEVRVVRDMRPGLRFDHYGYYGYRAGLYHPWYDQKLTTRSYTRGTLTIDLVDAERDQVAWTARAQGRVSREAIEDPESAIQETVADMFRQFP